LTDLPIGNYTANRLVFCGASTNTLDAFSGLTWANPTLSVPGTVSATNVSSSGGLNATSLGVSGSATISGSLRAKSLFTTVHNFANAGLAAYYIPFMSTVEATTPTYLDHMIAPANGRLVKAFARLSGDQSGSVIVDVHATSAAQETIQGSDNKERVTVTINHANTTYTFATSGSQHFTEGDIVGIRIDPLAASDNVNVTCVWEYDFTNT